MRTIQAKITEIGWQEGIGRTAWIECPPGARPAPGRYVLAWSPEDPEAPLATPLFAMDYSDGSKAGSFRNAGFKAAPPLPGGWGPGTPLLLRGPLGKGFTPPANLRRLALAAVDTSLARLLPLMRTALEQGAAVAVYTDQPAPPLPLAVEINPLSALGEAGNWADYIAIDCGEGSQTYGLPQEVAGIPGQLLVRVVMPCGGIAGCGACAVITLRGPRLACTDGPVFDLNELPAG